MLFRILSLLFLSCTLSFGQVSDKNKDTTQTYEDYWETELSPITDLVEIVSYIHNDPFKNVFVENIPGGNPLEREVDVNSFYGLRNHPIHKLMKFHRGIDLKGSMGEAVIASGNGVVIKAGYQEDIGNFIKIKHKYGFESLYGHLSSISVKEGQKVKKHQRIGKVGATGKVTGPHLHYTLKKNGVYLDPFDFLFMNFEEKEYN